MLEYIYLLIRTFIILSGFETKWYEILKHLRFKEASRKKECEVKAWKRFRLRRESSAKLSLRQLTNND